MRKAARVERIQKFLESRGVREDSRNWLVQALDPFHDTDIPPTGYPDWATSESVVAVIEQSATISAPAGQSTGTWDCHVFSMPLLAGNTTMLSASPTYVPSFYRATDDSLQGPSSLTAFTAGSLTHPSTINIVKVNNGGDTWPYVGYATPTYCEMSVLDCGASWATNAARLVGVGFEVANTTADIYKQGSVCYYSAPNALTPGMTTSIGAASGATTPVPMYCMRGMSPPGTFNQAVLLPGSVIREAADGAYVVPHFQSTENLLRNPSGYVAIWEPVGGVSSTNATGNWPTNAVSPAAGAMFTKYPQQSFADIETSGAYFAGLSLQTTLTITARFYVEIVPMASNTTLAVLRKPTPADDPMVRYMYKAIVENLPPGCMLDDNAEGGWWDTILGVAKSVLPAVGAALTPIFPPAAAIGSALGGLAAMAQGSAGGKPAVKSASPAAMAKPPSKVKVKATRARKVPAMPVIGTPRRDAARKLAQQLSDMRLRSAHDPREVIVVNEEEYAGPASAPHSRHR